MASIALYYVPQYAYDMTVGDPNTGKTDGLWAAGYVSFTAMVICHHLQLGIGTRTHAINLSSYYLLSFLLFFPMTV